MRNCFWISGVEVKTAPVNTIFLLEEFFSVISYGDLQLIVSVLCTKRKNVVSEGSRTRSQSSNTTPLDPMLRSCSADSPGGAARA